MNNPMTSPTQRAGADDPVVQLVVYRLRQMAIGGPLAYDAIIADEAADTIAALQARIAELEARNAASERDAGRYRWLRDCDGDEEDSVMIRHDYGPDELFSGDKLDAAIDAHAQGQAGEEKDG